MNLFPPPPPKYEQIKYYNGNYCTDQKGKELMGNEKIFYKEGDRYRNIGTLNDILVKGKSSKMRLDNAEVDMGAKAGDLYIMRGGYKKRKTIRSKSKKNRKQKMRKTRKT